MTKNEEVAQEIADELDMHMADDCVTYEDILPFLDRHYPPVPEDSAELVETTENIASLLSDTFEPSAPNPIKFEGVLENVKKAIQSYAEQYAAKQTAELVALVREINYKKLTIKELIAWNARCDALLAKIESEAGK
ncbi:MAG: hypothetical protein PHG61_09875 [Candidatus Marinimicrobia bacterium]|nr:hypothetical protein [Candidatus Neomarinimicrobiota bacterium]